MFAIFRQNRIFRFLFSHLNETRPRQISIIMDSETKSTMETCNVDLKPEVAIISVSDKTDIVKTAKRLQQLGLALYGSGKFRDSPAAIFHCSVQQSSTTTTTTTIKANQSPKGNMWSAIPVDLLCMVVKRNERKQGSGQRA